MSLTSEEDYLEQLEFEKENYREMIKTEYGQKSIDYYRFMIDEVDRDNLAESIASEIKDGIINVIDTYEV